MTTTFRRASMQSALAAHELAAASEGADDAHLELLDELRALVTGMEPLRSAPLWIHDDGCAVTVYTKSEVERAVAAVAADLLAAQVTVDGDGDRYFGAPILDRFRRVACCLWSSRLSPARALAYVLAPYGQDAIAEAFGILDLE